jgi:hypothetical protein
VGWTAEIFLGGSENRRIWGLGGRGGLGLSFFWTRGRLGLEKSFRGWGGDERDASVDRRADCGVWCFFSLDAATCDVDKWARGRAGLWMVIWVWGFDIHRVSDLTVMDTVMIFYL